MSQQWHDGAVLWSLDKAFGQRQAIHHGGVLHHAR